MGDLFGELQAICDRSQGVETEVAMCNPGCPKRPLASPARPPAYVLPRPAHRLLCNRSFRDAPFHGSAAASEEEKKVHTKLRLSRPLGYSIRGGG